MVNQYPPWWDTTITVYNKYVDPASKKTLWLRHKVDGCFWKQSDDKIKIGNTVLETDNITCRVRIDPLFVPANAWKTLPEEDKLVYFTLGVGDIVVRGEVTDEVDEYTAGQRSSDLLTKYHSTQDCLQIEKVVINVGNRGMEHYRVKGV